MSDAHTRAPMVSILLCCAAGACGPIMDERLPDRTERVRAYLSALVAQSKVPGIQYLVMDSTRTLFEYDGGWADIRGHVPMESSTTMMAYSMSKTITAAAVLRLVEARRIGLDDPSGPLRGFEPIWPERHGPPAGLAHIGDSEPDSPALGARGSASRRV